MVGDKLMNVMGKLDKKNKTNTFAIKETFCNTFAKDTDGALRRENAELLVTCTSNNPILYFAIPIAESGIKIHTLDHSDL